MRDWVVTPLAPVVVAGAEIDPLGETDVIGDGDGGKVIDAEVFAEPAVVTNGEAPGKLNPHPRFNGDPPADVGTKAAQGPGFKGADGEPGAGHQGGTDKVPE